MTTSNEDRAARLLFDARASKKRLPGLPEELQPKTLEEARRIQDSFVRLSGTVGGWKVAVPKPGEDPPSSPVPGSQVIASPAAFPDSKGVGPEVEVEIAIRFARDLPPRPQPYAKDEVVAAIGSIHPAIEVMSSRYADRKAMPPLATMADIQSNGAIVFGEGPTDWKAHEFAKVGMVLYFDGKEAGKATGGASTAAILEALTWLANHAVKRNGGIKAGFVILTGARIGPVSVPSGTKVRAEVDGLGSVAVNF